VLLLLPVAVRAWRYWTFTAAVASEERTFLGEMLALSIRSYRDGNYLDATALRVRENYEFYVYPSSYLWFSNLFLTMLIGMLVGCRRYIQDARSHVPLLKRAAVWTGIVGLAAAITMAVLQRVTRPFQPTPLWIVQALAYALQRPALMLCYASVIVLLTLNVRWGPRLALLQPMGRMPLTNYLMQSVIGTSIFYGHGLGYYERVGPATVMALAVLIYGTQCVYSAWWFRRWQFGPMEALWRALTYGAWPDMRVHEVTPGENPVLT
jgi:uncharacterized protein